MAHFFSFLYLNSKTLNGLEFYKVKRNIMTMKKDKYQHYLL